MKKVEELEKEYEGFKQKTKTVTNLEEFLSYIDLDIGEYEYATKAFKKELRENALWRLEAKIRNFFFFIFAEEDVELYDLDDAVVIDCITLTEEMADFFKRLHNIAKEDNYKELIRLVDYADELYDAQRDYYDYERDRIEITAQGIYMINSRYENNRTSLIEFLNKKVTELEAKAKKEKTPQYVKGKVTQ